jgi:hypothetical protein
MTYSYRLPEIGSTTLQFLIDWAILGIKDGNYAFDNMFMALMNEKLNRYEQEA